jgi:phosphate starvation-inducible protein PhoH
LSSTTEKTLILDPSELLAFCGRNDHKIRMLEAGLETTIRVRGNEVVISGDPGQVERASGVREDLLSVQRGTGRSLSNEEVQRRCVRLWRPR